MKPLVDGVKPPKMPKNRKIGLMKWIKSITGLEVEEVKEKKKPRRVNKRTNNINNRKKPTNKNKKFQNKSNKPKTNNKSKNKINENKMKNVKPRNNSRKPQFKKEDQNKIKKTANVDNASLKIKEPVIKEIIKDKKPKKDIPTRAKNDPRQKN